MNKSWNKIVLAALLTAGASAGILYLKHRQRCSAVQNREDDLDDDSLNLSADPSDPDSDRTYIDLALTHDLQADTEKADAGISVKDGDLTETETVSEEVVITPAEEHISDDVHFSSL